MLFRMQEEAVMMVDEGSPTVRRRRLAA